MEMFEKIPFGSVSKNGAKHAACWDCRGSGGGALVVCWLLKAVGTVLARRSPMVFVAVACMSDVSAGFVASVPLLIASLPPVVGRFGLCCDYSHGRAEPFLGGCDAPRSLLLFQCQD